MSILVEVNAKIALVDVKIALVKVEVQPMLKSVPSFSNIM